MISMVMEDYCLVCSHTALMKFLPPDYANVSEILATALPCTRMTSVISVYGHLFQDLPLFIAL